MLYKKTKRGRVSSCTALQKSQWPVLRDPCLHPVGRIWQLPFSNTTQIVSSCSEWWNMLSWADRVLSLGRERGFQERPSKFSAAGRGCAGRSGSRERYSVDNGLGSQAEEVGTWRSLVMVRILVWRVMGSLFLGFEKKGHCQYLQNINEYIM